MGISKFLVLLEKLHFILFFCSYEQTHNLRGESVRQSTVNHLSIGFIVSTRVWFLYTASPQQDDLRLSGPPSGQGVGGGAQTRDRRVPADLRTDSQATVPPMLPFPQGN
ncbi:hypothetical protein PoB_002354700 [Plakobranchus ocellatus]|uniref:Secreted protein n=1 Tax=Plakobranchus ocellatus TaxID=259542 RepID=A0AAV3ZR91_9GAST|nr:hypothetical protein PoB_002354700 [Plakobranchus ocellatus]